MEILFASFLAASAGFVAAAEFKIGAHTFTLPEGFTIELVASSPLVDRPIEADFDDEGRLYVTDSSGSNDKPDKQLIEKPHRIVRLEDTDGDGKFDKSVVFADKMMFPEGAMWLDGSLYVSAPPSIWKLTDTDGDGVADKREEWFKGGTLTGCANDLHGPYLGPDGWIYWNKGAFAKQTHERAGEPPIVTRAAHTFRMRPNGTGLETVMTGGMDNPVGLTFTQEGERFFTSTFVIQPQAGKRDGLVHAIYGGVYGKENNDVVDDHPQTGDLMPITTHLGPAAPCGLMRYESGAMDMKNNLFVCQFNLHKISRHVLIPDGSTYKTENSDFVTVTDTDFHPTDILEDADGSILIVDTGGWYKLCCPTSQLAKPDVLGAIYRVRKTGMKKIERLRNVMWRAMSPQNTALLLGHDSPAIRKAAVAHLVADGSDAAIAAVGDCLARSNSVQIRLRAVWTLGQMKSKEALPFIRFASNDPSPSVRIAAAHVVSLIRDSKSSAGLLDLLTSGSPPEKRVAAEAIGRLRNAAAVPAILRAATLEMDRTLEHSLAFALIEIGKADPVREGLKAANVNERKVALIALSQIPGGLKADEVAPLLSGDGDLRKTAEWIVSKHPEWGANLANTFRPRLKEATSLAPTLANLASSPEIQALLVEWSLGMNRDAAIAAMKAMAASHLKKAPDSWTAALAQRIDANSTVRGEAIATARALNFGKEATSLIAALKEAATNIKRFETRLVALRALPEGTVFEAPHFKTAVMGLDSPASETRGDAVAALARASLSDEQRLELADALAKAGPMELTRLFDLFEKHPNETLGLRLVEALKKSTVLATLPPDWMTQRLAKFPESVRKAAEALPRPSQGDAMAQRAHLEEMLAGFKGGDIRRGQAIFNDAKVACVSCHSMGYIGGKVGPDLTAIGQTRTEMDLLEAILYPSASFVRSYEPVVVKTKDGEPHTGILRADNEQGVLLVNGPNAEERIARADIADIRPGTVSIMPAGLESQLNKQELADLLAFLKATKWGAN